jgi:hypothetical protein
LNSNVVVFLTNINLKIANSPTHHNQSPRTKKEKYLQRFDMRVRAWWHQVAGQVEASQSRAADEISHLLFLAFASQLSSALNLFQKNVNYEPSYFLEICIL